MADNDSYSVFYHATDLNEMLARLETYLDKKKMILSAEKTKIVEFRKGKGKENGTGKIIQQLKIHERRSKKAKSILG